MDLFFTLNLIYWDFEEVSTQSMVTIADRYESSKLLKEFTLRLLCEIAAEAAGISFFLMLIVTSNHQILL